MAKSVRSTSVFSNCLRNYVVNIGKAPNVRFASGGSNKPQTSHKMDKDKDEANTGANKSISGGGYAKRSDEEGFGALHGGNQSLYKEDEDKIVHANVPEYDRSKKSS
ncbi:hypothetical protein C2S53_001853 [Perilla frutescens var. hirtella]|uniref:Uncharacterized protein n=1 Tax=Perilla frutescens var. hirtella TaxID=608512 RepID=A0AAD4P569_PERFH|nr:hypothetical protein C2S53_001853 [Perilla frutescens var. hirtella]